MSKVTYADWFKRVNKYLVNFGGYKVTGDLSAFYALGKSAQETAQILKEYQGW